MEISVSGSKIWWRNFPVNLYFTGIDLWIYDDHCRIGTWAYDEKESGGSVSCIWKSRLVVSRWMDQCDHTGFNRAVLFCDRRMGY